MSGIADLAPSMIERIRNDLVGLRMPRALEALDQIVRRLEHAEISALEGVVNLTATGHRSAGECPEIMG